MQLLEPNVEFMPIPSSELRKTHTLKTQPHFSSGRYTASTVVGLLT